MRHHGADVPAAALGSGPASGGEREPAGRMMASVPLDGPAVLAAYDEQVRRRPEAEGGEVTVEREPGVIRVLAEGWRGVTWFDGTALDVDAAIERQVERFAGLGAWEWKHYGHDRPADLPQRLLRAGFVAEPAETLLVAPVADVAREVPVPEGVELRPVVDAEGVAALVRVHEEVFGPTPGGSAVSSWCSCRPTRRRPRRWSPGRATCRSARDG